MPAFANRRALQAAVAIFACVPVSAGLAGAVFGLDFVGPPGERDAESHMRYLSGLLFAIGLGFWSTIPAIERRAARFGLLTLIVAAGGLARLGSLAADGLPGGPMIFALAMELAVTPALWFWQRRVAHGFSQSPESPPPHGPV